MDGAENAHRDTLDLQLVAAGSHSSVQDLGQEGRGQILHIHVNLIAVRVPHYCIA